MAFEVPSRQTLVFELVGRDHITNALALHSTVFNLARFLGPALAGLLMASGGIAYCFYLKAASAAVILGILAWLKRVWTSPDPPRTPTHGVESTTLHALREVLAFVDNDRRLKHVLAIIATFSVLLLPYSVLLPAFGRDALGLGAREYGFLCAANGLGAFGGAIIVAIWGHCSSRERWWWVGAILFPLCLLTFSTAQSYGHALLLICGAGTAMVITSNSAISLLQLAATDALRSASWASSPRASWAFSPWEASFKGPWPRDLAPVSPWEGALLPRWGWSLSWWLVCRRS